MRWRPQIVWKAAALLAAGTAICAVISDPLVEAVSSFSKVTRPCAAARAPSAPATRLLPLPSVPQAALFALAVPVHTRSCMPRMASAGCLACIGAGCSSGSLSLPYSQTTFSLPQASGIPAFYVAFCVTPFASNASELVSSLLFARRKRRKNISLTFSQARARPPRLLPASRAADRARLAAAAARMQGRPGSQRPA